MEKSRGKPPPIATDYYTLLAWLKNYMMVLRVLFGNKYPLLLDHETIRNTLLMVKRRNSVYFTRSNVVNLIWRLFTESRSYFAIMSNEEDLKNRHLPYTNLASTAAIVANCQPIRGEDLPIELMPIKNTTGYRDQNRGG